MPQLGGLRLRLDRQFSHPEAMGLAHGGLGAIANVGRQIVEIGQRLLRGVDVFAHGSDFCMAEGSFSSGL